MPNYNVDPSDKKPGMFETWQQAVGMFLGLLFVGGIIVLFFAFIIWAVERLLGG